MQPPPQASQFWAQAMRISAIRSRGAIRSEVVKKLIQSPKNRVFGPARGGILPYLDIFSQPLSGGAHDLDPRVPAQLLGEDLVNDGRVVDHQDPHVPAGGLGRRRLKRRSKVDRDREGRGQAWAPRHAKLEFFQVR